MIARAAEGSMRDSQSLLDQAVSYSGMEIPSIPTWYRAPITGIHATLRTNCKHGGAAQVAE